MYEVQIISKSKISKSLSSYPNHCENLDKLDKRLQKSGAGYTNRMQNESVGAIMVGALLRQV